ncbi:MAG: DUF362 domain-containing protein [Theionarchaea archaeon]|nr:DUF362 domain-containing protein [Theionarchaea archaeon]
MISNIPKHLEETLGSRLEKSDVVAIKLHMGEEGNTRYIRPTIVRTIADWLSEKGTEPFVTDSTSLYKRKRGTLFDYLRTAARHGFTSETMGCPVLIADGIKSKGLQVEVTNPLKLESVGVASLIQEADAMVCLSHVTMHPDVLPAAGLKNMAMGCTDKEAKMRMHASDAKPKFNRDRCTGCGACVRHCPSDAIELVDGKASFVPEKCVSCAECIAFCNFGAVRVNWSSLSPDVCRGVIDAVRAISSTFAPGKLAFMNLGYDVTEECDCGGGSSSPIITDFGCLTGIDPVAVDSATADMINLAEAYPGGSLSDRARSPDMMSVVKPDVDWKTFLSMAEEQGVGHTGYEIVQI